MKINIFIVFFFSIRQFTTVVAQKSYWVTGAINNVNIGYILHSKYMIISIYYCSLKKCYAISQEFSTAVQLVIILLHVYKPNQPIELSYMADMSKYGLKCDSF